MDIKGVWWTAPANSDSGRLIMVTGRKDIDKFRANPRYDKRVEVSWKYDGDESGMPDSETSKLMEQVNDSLLSAFDRDTVAVMTGIYTGDDQRDWIFYTKNTGIFGAVLNKALSGFPLLPIRIYCENDPGWEEYDEMSETEIRMD